MVVLAVVVSQTPEGSVTRNLLLKRTQTADKETALWDGQSRPIGTLGYDAGCNEFTLQVITSTAILEEPHFRERLLWPGFCHGVLSWHAFSQAPRFSVPTSVPNTVVQGQPP